jgi:hypothetical protein
MRFPGASVWARFLVGAAAAVGGGAAAARTWTSVDGKYTVEADYVRSEGGKVVLKRSPDGKEISVDPEQLSARDQEEIARLEKDGVFPAALVGVWFKHYDGVIEGRGPAFCPQYEFAQNGAFRCVEPRVGGNATTTGRYSCGRRGEGLYLEVVNSKGSSEGDGLEVLGRNQFRWRSEVYRRQDLGVPQAAGEFRDARPFEVGGTVFDAADRGHLPALGYLVQKGQSLKAKDENGYSVLSHAFSSSASDGIRFAMMSMCLQAGADPNAPLLLNEAFKRHYQAREGEAQLAGLPPVAIARGPILRLLVKSGADVNQHGKVYSVLSAQVHRNCPLDDVKFLLESGAKAGEPGPNGYLPIQLAAPGTNVDQLLVAAGSPKRRYEDGPLRKP